MGRTYTNKRDDEWESPSRSKGKYTKHSRNIPGKGMRIINNMSEDDYEDDESEYEDNDKYEDTTLTQRKGR
jgi:hypothetical protein